MSGQDESAYNYRFRQIVVPSLFRRVNIKKIIVTAITTNLLRKSPTSTKQEGLIRLFLLSPCALPFRDDLLVSRPPTKAIFDASGRIHATDQPALIYPNGDEIGAITGIRVPAKIFHKRHGIKLDDILYESNMEVRRILIERYGIDRFLAGIHATPTSVDDYSTLYHSRNPRKQFIPDDETSAYVKLLNSTPEPGTTDVYKEYLLRVPPNVRTPQEAVAWSFNLETEEYVPDAQS
jgi:hypothetical protein